MGVIDSDQEPILHRDTTANDAAVSVDGATLAALIDPKGSPLNKALMVMPGMQVQFRFFARGTALSTKTFTFTLVGFDRATPPESGAAPACPKGRTLLVYTISMGAGTNASRNPVNGKADSYTWNEADALTKVSEATGVSAKQISGAESVLQVDVPHAYCFGFITSKNADMAQVLVSAQQISAI